MRICGYCKRECPPRPRKFSNPALETGLTACPRFPYATRRAKSRRLEVCIPRPDAHLHFRGHPSTSPDRLMEACLPPRTDHARLARTIGFLLIDRDGRPAPLIPLHFHPSQETL